jgi:hypothetical protein
MDTKLWCIIKMGIKQKNEWNLKIQIISKLKMRWIAILSQTVDPNSVEI